MVGESCHCPGLRSVNRGRGAHRLPETPRTAAAASESGTATATGTNNTAGAINNQGSNNTSVIGNQNRVTVTNNTGPKLFGKLEPASDPMTNIPFGNLPRGTFLIIYGSSAAYTRKFPASLLRVGNEDNLTLNKDNKGRITLTGEIFGADHRIIARIDKNNFRVNPNNYFQVENDKHTLTVIDQQNREVLFLRYMNRHDIRLRAYLYFPGLAQPVIITNTSTTIPGLVQTYENCDEIGPNSSVFTFSVRP